MYGLLPELPLIPEVVGIEVLFDEVHGRLHLLIEHEPVLNGGLTLHDLIDNAQLHILELLVQPQEMNQLWVLPAHIQHRINVHLGVLVEVVDGFDGAEHTVVVFVPVHSEVGLARDE